MLSLERVKAFSTTYKCLNNLVLRHFSVYSNESLKQNFEEKLKEKYFVRNQQNDDMNARGKMDLYSEMKEAHQNFYETLRKEGKNFSYSSIKPHRFHLEGLQKAS